MQVEGLPVNIGLSCNVGDRDLLVAARHHRKLERLVSARVPDSDVEKHKGVGGVFPFRNLEERKIRGGAPREHS